MSERAVIVSKYVGVNEFSTCAPPDSAQHTEDNATKQTDLMYVSPTRSDGSGSLVCLSVLAN